MNWIRENKKFLAFVAIVIVAMVLVRMDNEASDQTSYENQLSACKSGNVVRFVLHDFAEAAEQVRTETAEQSTGEEKQINEKAAHRYHTDQKRLENVEYAGKLGRKNCDAAIDKP